MPICTAASGHTNAVLLQVLFLQFWSEFGEIAKWPVLNIGVHLELRARENLTSTATVREYKVPFAFCKSSFRCSNSWQSNDKLNLILAHFAGKMVIVPNYSLANQLSELIRGQSICSLVIVLKTRGSSATLASLLK